MFLFPLCFEGKVASSRIISTGMSNLTTKWQHNHRMCCQFRPANVAIRSVDGGSGSGVKGEEGEGWIRKKGEGK